MKGETDSIKKIKGKGKKEKQAREFWWVIGTMLGLIIVFFIFYWFFQSLNNFTYEGLAFTKEKFGQIPVFHYYYYFNDEAGKTYQYNLYLRNDPRKNVVPVKGDIELSIGNPVYISIDSRELAYCPMSSVAVSSIASFLSNNLLDVKSGIADKSIAQELNRSYVTCETNANDDVIILKAGNTTEVTRENSCYVITAANCEIIPAVEKFIVQAIIDARKSK